MSLWVSFLSALTSVEVLIFLYSIVFILIVIVKGKAVEVAGSCSSRKTRAVRPEDDEDLKAFPA